MEAMLGLVPQSPNFVEEVWQASKGKLFFLDGYYDFGQGRFIEGFDGAHSFCTSRASFLARGMSSLSRSCTRR